MSDAPAQFSPGQLVTHRLFGYRGAIFDVDPNFQGSDDWYEKHAISKPPRNRPWYYVLVDGQPLETYVSERNLEADEDARPIRHPRTDEVFRSFIDGRYVLRERHN